MPIDNIVATAKSRFDERVKRRHLREAILQKMTIIHNGHLFNITPELFSMLTIFEFPEIILEDAYGVPTKCQREMLLVEAKQKYQEIMNLWYFNYHELDT
jgi:hypothetical protein